MLTLLSPLHRRLRSEHGFTLMETLVAMVAGLLVAFAATMLLRVSREQTERASSYVQASQLGRTTMTRIVDELNSACLRAGFTPIAEKSGPEKLIFEDAFSKEAEIPYSQIQHHEIVWTKTTGTLTDTKEVATGVNGTGEYIFSNPTPVVIGTHVGKNGPEAKPEPIFQYYQYSKAAVNSTEAGVTPLEPIELKESETLSSTQAVKVAAVQVSFRAYPNDGRTFVDSSDPLRSQVIFAFSAPIAEPTITDEPCQ
jgi:prepilin-type N-terminal cleavage/methylation domain-containing protein